MSTNQRRLAVKHTRAAISAIRNLSFLRLGEEDVNKVCSAIGDELRAARDSLLAKPPEFKLKVKDE